MPAKAEVLEQLGEAALILPDLISRSLASNDRIKYLLALLQTAREHAEHPERAVPSLQTEREASGVDEVSLDAVVAGSSREGEEWLHIPHARHIHTLIVDDMRQMLQPLRAASARESASDTSGTPAF